MNSPSINERFAALSTPIVSDACLRLSIPLRIADFGVAPLVPGTRAAGRALPARHAGSVDVFLEALEESVPGDVMVIDNANRRDEGCIGDLMVLEMQGAGLAGVVVWGTVRDSVELRAIGFPVFCHGVFPAGPRRLDARSPDALTAARFGSCTVTRDDVVFADPDGVMFVPGAAVASVLDAAEEIAERERSQSALMRQGRSLRDQFALGRYLVRREANPDLTFRQHLREMQGEIEV